MKSRRQSADFMIKKSSKRKKRLWGNKSEKAFKEHKSDMRMRLTDKISSDAWSNVIMGSITQILGDKQNEAKKGKVAEKKKKKT